MIDLSKDDRLAPGIYKLLWHAYAVLTRAWDGNIVIRMIRKSQEEAFEAEALRGSPRRKALTDLASISRTAGLSRAEAVFERCR